jgi:hypothetical protein
MRRYGRHITGILLVLGIYIQSEKYPRYMTPITDHNAFKHETLSPSSTTRPYAKKPGLLGVHI